MGIAALIAGIVGGLCAIVGVLIAADVITIEMGMAAAGWEFWLMIAGILLLGSIAMLLARRNNSVD